MLFGLIKWILFALALILVSMMIPGIEVAGFFAALIAVAAIGMVNLFLRPLLMFLTLPINILTLGIFTFIVNAILFGLAAFIVPGFSVGGFFPALFGSLVYSIFSLLINFASGEVKPA